MSTLYLKSLAAGRMTTYGVGQWPKVGAWSERKTPVLCESGWHLCRDTLDLLGWLNDELYVATSDCPPIVGGDKVVVARARLVRRLKAWTPRRARLLACDFAEHTLHIFEAARPGDTRPRDCIEVARLYAVGKADDAARDAAGAAAGAAAGDAAGAAAWDAERKWQARRLAEVLDLADGPLDGALRNARGRAA